MDYKYIEQLMERYWRCETSLQEEEILRAFFAQEDVPSDLMPYKSLFDFVQQDEKENVLDATFDKKVLALIEEEKPVKAKVVTLRERLAPLFKAAAVVAILITLGNAVQSAFDANEPATQPTNTAGVEKIEEGSSMAQANSMKTDTLQHKLNASDSTITR